MWATTDAHRQTGACARPFRINFSEALTWPPARSPPWLRAIEILHANRASRVATLSFSTRRVRHIPQESQDVGGPVSAAKARSMELDFVAQSTVSFAVQTTHERAK